MREDAGPAAPPALAPDPRALGRGERLALGVAFVALLVFRTIFVHRLPFDSDEAQHLHVAWSWSQGLVAYRDFFDNHTPVFHLLTAPFVRAVGERAEILIFARYLMLPLFAAALWLTASIGRRLFGARVGTYAALLLGCHSEFFAPSLQFRTDDLWIVGWLAAVRVLLCGAWSTRRAFAGGLLLGLAIGVSMKTTFLAATLGGGALVGFAVCPAARAGWSVRRAASGVLAVAAGAVVVPAILVAALGSAHALDDFVYCTLRHNAMTLGSGGWRPWQHYILAGALASVLAAATALGRSRIAPGDRARQLAFLGSGGLAASLLFTVWPTSSRQDGLPLLVVAAVAVAVVLVDAVERWGSGATAGAPAGLAGRRATAVCLALAAAFLTRIALTRHEGREPELDLSDLREVLRLTDPGDYVMDAKGDAVFRTRPFYFALELFTKHRLRNGTIADTIVARCVETGTGVLFGDFEPYPRATRALLFDRYVGSGRLRVAGALLGALGAGEARRFEILVPGTYAMTREGAEVRGTLDGSPFDAPRALTAGPHVFVASEPSTGVAVLWAKAAARGFRPLGAGPADR